MYTFARYVFSDNFLYTDHFDHKYLVLKHLFHEAFISRDFSLALKYHCYFLEFRDSLVLEIFCVAPTLISLVIFVCR